MIRHSFKLIWNQKRKNAFTILELFLIFIVIFVSSSFLLEKLIKYHEGVGAKTEGIYYLSVLGSEEIDGEHMQPMLQLQQIFNELDWVEEVSITQDASPFIWSYMGSSIYYNDNNTTVAIKQVDHLYDNVLDMELVDGKWFDAEDTSKTPIPVVLDKMAAENLFGDSTAIGKIALLNNKKVQVVGVISHFKRSNYEDKDPTMFIPITRYGAWNRFSRTEFLFKLKENIHPNPKELKTATFSILSPEHYNIRKSSFLDRMKASANSYENSQLLSIILITIFLIFNFLLGLIGILGYNISKRKSEIGIRRAVGSTKRRIRQLLIFEINCVTLLALIPAVIIVVQIPLLNIMSIPTDMFFKALGVTILVIFTLVTITVYYPSVLASKIEPALAIKDE